MYHLICVILGRIKENINEFAEDTAEALEEGDKLRFAKNLILGLIFALEAIMIVVGVIALLIIFRRQILSILAVPLGIVILIASYRANKADKQYSRSTTTVEERLAAELEAEDTYGYVRDALFLVLREVSEYTLSIKRPSSPSEIEATSRYEIRDGIAVFKFTVRTTGEVDTKQLMLDMDKVISQKLRAGELRNLPPRMVIIDGRYYAPIQILSITDISSYLNIDVCLANERSVALINEMRRFVIRRRVEDALYDDEL